MSTTHCPCHQLGFCQSRHPPCPGCAHKGRLLQYGYVQTVPGCGDCTHSEPAPQGLYCEKHLSLVADDARCLAWEPHPAWLAANPQVARAYTAASPTGLSRAEQAYTQRDHALNAVDPLESLASRINTVCTPPTTEPTAPPKTIWVNVPKDAKK